MGLLPPPLTHKELLILNLKLIFKNVYRMSVRLVENNECRQTQVNCGNSAQKSYSICSKIGNSFN